MPGVRKIRRLLRFAALSAAVVSIASAPCRGEAPPAPHGGRVAAEVRFRSVTVNGNPIPERRMAASLKLRITGLQAFHAPLSDSRLSELARDVEEKETIKELLIQDAARRGVHVGEEEFLRYLDKEDRRYGGEEKYRKYRDGIGLEEDDYRALMMRNLTLEKYVAQVIGPTVVVTDGEVRERYDRDRWLYEIPETVRFHAITLKVVGASLSPQEDAMLRSSLRSVETEQDFREEGESLIRKLAGRVTAERNPSLEWTEQGGGDLWDNLRGLPVGKAGVFQERGTAYFLYFVKERVPGGAKVAQGEAFGQIRNQMLREKMYRDINAKVQELKGSASIRME